MGKLLTVTVYLDETPFFGNPVFDNGDDNIFSFTVTEEIVREWYRLHEEEFIKAQMHELKIPREECSFEKWWNEVSITEDFDGFYDFCFRPHEESNDVEELDDRMERSLR